MSSPKSRVLALLTANLDDVVPRIGIVKAMGGGPYIGPILSRRYDAIFDIVTSLRADGHAIEEWPDGVRLLALAENEVES